METGKAKRIQESVLLSVIIPTYNMSHCIDKCLDSIFKQKIDRMEVLVVDDASNDDLRGVLEPYMQKGLPIVPICLEKNGGVSNARNIGIQTAKGEYLHFVDADDLVPDGAYRQMVKRVAESHCDIVTGNYIFESSTVREEVRYYAPEGLARCLESNNLSLCNKWFRRQFILDNQLVLDTGMRTAEDAMFCFQAYHKHPSVCSVNHFIYCYNYDDHDELRHIHRDLHIENSLKVLEENFTQEVPEETEKLWAEALLNYTVFIYNNIWSKMQDPASKQEAFCKMQQTFRKICQANKAYHFGYNAHAVAFEALVGCDYMTFVTIDYQQYTLIRLLQRHMGTAMPQGPAGSVPELFLEECRRGRVGMKLILKAIRNWFAFKLSK